MQEYRPRAVPSLSAIHLSLIIVVVMDIGLSWERYEAEIFACDLIG